MARSAYFDGHNRLLNHPAPTHISGHALIEPVTPIKKLILP